jgi:hypothetical protein
MLRRSSTERREDDGFSSVAAWEKRGRIPRRGRRKSGRRVNIIRNGKGAAAGDPPGSKAGLVC